MTDRIVLRNIRVDGRHGVLEEEIAVPQPFEVDVELSRDLARAGTTDDLAMTIDYRMVDEIVRRIVATRSYRLLETIAEAIAAEVAEAVEVDEILVRVRKPQVRLGGPLDFAGVEVRRRGRG